MPFSSSFQALGIQVELDRFNLGVITFANTAKRASELIGVIDAVLTKGSMSQAESLRLRGRMQFAEGQVFGRIGRLCLREITRHAFEGSTDVLGHDCKEAFEMFRELLSQNRPRELALSAAQPWFIFTDASYEPSAKHWRCCLGGILYDANGKAVEFFSFGLSREHMNCLGADRKRTIIFEAELLAILVALDIWSYRLSGSPVVVYIDNNSARDVCISGSGRSSLIRAMIARVITVEDSVGCFPWYGRVPSPSNPADPPSRNSCGHLVSRGVARVEIGSQVDHLLSSF